MVNPSYVILHLVLLHITEGWQISWQVESGEELLHVERRAKVSDLVGHHGGDHLAVPELVRLTVILQNDTNAATGREADLRPGEPCGWFELLQGLRDS